MSISSDPELEHENGHDLATGDELDGIHGSASINTGNNGYLLQRPLDAPSAAIMHATVAASENDDAVEIPCDPFGNLPVKTLQIEFPAATGLKYRNPDTGNFRMIAPFEMDDESVLAPPADGWEGKLFIACLPQKAAKRTFPGSSAGGGGVFDSPSVAKMGRGGGDNMGFMASGPSPGFGLPSGFGGNIQVVPPSRSVRGPGNVGFLARGGMPGRNRGRGFPGRGGPMQRGRGRGRGTGPPSAGPNTFDYCTLCDAKLNCQNQCDMHYGGKKHAENLAIQAAGGVPRRAGRSRGGPGRGGPRGRGDGMPDDGGSNFVPTGIGRGSQIAAGFASDFQSFDY